MAMHSKYDTDLA